MVVADTDRLLSTVTASLRHRANNRSLLTAPSQAFLPLAGQLSKVLTVRITRGNSVWNWRALRYMATVLPKEGRR